MLAGLCHNLNLKQTNEFILKLTHEKELLKGVSLLIEAHRQVEAVSVKDISDYFLYKLAAKVKISEILILSESAYFAKNRSKRYEIGEEIYKRAKELNILNKKLPPILGGSDLLKLGLAPSEQFSKILNEAYEAQMSQKFKNHEEATFWLIEYLKTL
jgi:tRNA nucleotidyltransferase (CCA-adding enzyme)